MPIVLTVTGERSKAISSGPSAPYALKDMEIDPKGKDPTPDTASIKLSIKVNYNL
jgi:hypothetical protein